MKWSISKCSFAIGGFNPTLREMKSVEVIGNDISFNLPPLPITLVDHSFVVTIDNELMIIGGIARYDIDQNKREPMKANLIFRGTKWTNHSVPLQPRRRPISISMPNGIYVFGGTDVTTSLSERLESSEFLANGKMTWEEGPKLPGEAEFMEGGHGVAISDTEFVIVGGQVITQMRKDETSGNILCHYYASKQIWKFNTITEEWRLIGNLNEARFNHKVASLGDIVIVTGGFTYDDSKSKLVVSNSTEIFDPHTAIVEPQLVGKLNVSRFNHGMGIISKHGFRRLISFGGFNNKNYHLDSIEEWNPDKKEWKLLQQKLSQKRTI